ncbi:hypothetical protein M0805_005786 [Coniferiporia weirii]|nr:hypothetical protein M0805_005786 [Coniferiporia weirii]
MPDSVGSTGGVGGPSPSVPGRVWVITGTSSGLGRLLVEDILARGDRVIATARKPDSIRDLLTKFDDASNPRIHLLQLDVTAPFSALQEAAAVAVGKWGRVDVLVNNAGAGMLGISEEVGVEGYKTQFATNFFGALNVTNAFLPYMRKRRSGTIVFVGSRSSWRSDVPMLGTYAASKAALSAASDALSVELAPLNIRVLNVLPGGMRTPNWDNMILLPTSPHAIQPSSSITVADTNGNAAQHDAEQHIADYAALRARQLAWMYAQTGTQPGDPEKCARAIVGVVCSAGADDGGDSNAATKDGSPKAGGRGWPDLNMLVLGSDAEANIRDKCARVVKNLDEWKDVVKGVDINAKL